MKNFKRIVASVVMFISLLAINPVVAYAGNLAIGWAQIDGKWYYFNQSGAMQTGWVKTDDKWYFLGSNGELYMNCRTPDGYQVDDTGAWIH